MLCVHAHAVVCGFPTKYCEFDPRRVQSHTSFFSFSISGWLATSKCVCLSLCCGKTRKGKKKLSLAESSHCEPCGVRPGSSTVVVSSISLAICLMVQFWYENYASAELSYHILRRWAFKGPRCMCVSACLSVCAHRCSVLTKLTMTGRTLKQGVLTA